MTKFFALN